MEKFRAIRLDDTMSDELELAALLDLAVAASGSPPSPEKPIEWRAIAPMAWLQRRKGDVSNRPIMYAGPLDPRIVHDPGELWEWFALYSRKTIEAYLLAVRASSGSTGAPDEL
jgi:hypothetical protein